jgi:hypothetical protein
MSKILYGICPKKFTFRDIHWRQMGYHSSKQCCHDDSAHAFEYTLITQSAHQYSVVNAGRPPYKNAIIAALGRQQKRRSRNVTLELGLSQPKVVEVHCDDRLHPYHYLRSSRIFPNDRSVLMYISEYYDMNVLKITSFTRHFMDRQSVFYAWGCVVGRQVTYKHRIILVLSANMGIKSTWASTFWLVSLGTLSWVPTCYPTSWSLKGF